MADAKTFSIHQKKILELFIQLQNMMKEVKIKKRGEYKILKQLKLIFVINN